MALLVFAHSSKVIRRLMACLKQISLRKGRLNDVPGGVRCLPGTVIAERNLRFYQGSVRIMQDVKTNES
jgi:hypothetical protein